MALAFAASSHRPLDGVIKKTLTNTFIAVAGMWLITAGASAVSMQLGLSFGLGTQIGALVVAIALIFGIFAMRNSVGGLVMLALLSALMGLLIGPVMGGYLKSANGAMTVALSAALTATATFGCATYCVASRRSFSHWGAALSGGLWVLIGISLVSMFVPVPGLSLAIAAASAVLFLGWMLYDIGKVVSGEETNYIVAATGIYLDTLNLFMSLLQLLAGSGRDE